jgi:flagellar motility protein MotE (MotC chaperone)
VTPVASATSANDPLSISQNQTVMTHALQKRLQEKERTIAVQTQQIKVLSSQLEALKQIDQETHRQPRKQLGYPIP